jgi:prophage regulatory protein
VNSRQFNRQRLCSSTGRFLRQNPHVRGKLPMGRLFLLLPSAETTDRLTKRSKPMTGPSNSGFMRCHEVLELVPIGRSTLYQWVKEKRFPAQVKNGKTSFWRREDVMAWLADPSNSAHLAASDLTRLADKSAMFRGDTSRFMKVGSAAENVVLAYLATLYRSAQIKPNAYDRACLARVEQRMTALEAGERSALDIFALWRPD